MKDLEKYTSKRFKRLHTLLKAFPGHEAKESNHKIRLEIKRIKAVLGLIHFHNKKFHAHKHYIPFRTIFRFAGKMREAGLQQELLEQYTQSYMPFYRSPVKGIDKFKKEIPGLIKEIKKHEKIIQKEIKPIKRWLYTTYIQQRKTALIKKLSNGYTSDELHRIRKQIKELIYLTSIDKFATAEPLLTSMAELIGNWHDKVLLLKFLSVDKVRSSNSMDALKSEISEDLKHLNKLTKEYVRTNQTLKSRKILKQNV